MKPIIFILVIASRIVFLWFASDPDNPVIWEHPLTHKLISRESWIWQIGNFVPIILLGFMSIFGDKSWLITTVVFTGLAVLDYADWILEGNNVWWHNGIYPVSMNTLTAFVFMLTFMYEFMKYGKSGRCKI